MLAEAMDDPYRPASEDSPRRVIARRSNGSIVAHLMLSLLGVLSPVVVMTWGRGAPELYVVAFLAVPAGLFGLGRSLHALMLPHAVELDGKGLRLAWGDKITAVPWLQPRDCELAWSDLRGVSTHTVSVNGVSSTSLVVRTAESTLEIPDDRFNRSAELIQREILDFLSLSRERPVGAASAFARACRERFATPVLMRANPGGLIGTSVFLLALMLVPLYLAWVIPFWITYGLAGLSVVLFGYLVMTQVQQWRSGRLLQLRPDGLALGPDEAHLHVIAWDELHAVRRVVTNNKTEALELVTRDGKHTRVSLHYGIALDLLADLLDPSRSQ